MRKFFLNTQKFHWLHWVVLVSSLALTLTAWWVSKSRIDEKVEAKFEREASQVVELITERLQKYEDSLWGGVSAISALGGDSTLSQWQSFSETLQIESKYPGIMGLGVIYYLRAYEKNMFLRKQRKLRPNFDIFPEHEMSEFWPITYIEPVKVNSKAVGLDMAHEVNRFTAAKKARDTGRAQITGPIILVQDSEKTPGFLFYAPFYSNEKEARRRRADGFKGLVYAPFMMKELMAGTLREEARHVGVKISDEQEILYDELSRASARSEKPPMFTKRISKDLYGRNWVFDIHANDSFRFQAANSQPWIILGGGIIIDLLLLVLFITLTRSNKRAFAYAKKMHEAAEKQGSIAANSAKLAALGEMAGNVAHEINNPLAMISLNMMTMKGILKKSEAPNAKVLSLVEKVEDIVKRIEKIVKSMRSLARDGSTDPFERALIQDIVSDTLSICAEKYKNDGVNLVVNMPEEEVYVECRRTEISQVLINLLNNAYYVVAKQKDPYIEINITTQGQRLVVHVIDNGPGIPKELQGRIMEPFYTTKKLGEGTGLGLSISASILEHHKGLFYLDTSCEKTTFVFVLPLDKLKESQVS